MQYSKPSLLPYNTGFDTPALQRSFSTTRLGHSKASEQSETDDLTDSMAYSMVNLVEVNPISHFDGDSNEDPQKYIKVWAKDVDKQIRKIFGKSLKKQDWPYHFEEHGLITKIRTLALADGRITLCLAIYDRNNKLITRDFQRVWKIHNGRPRIDNSWLSINGRAKSQNIKIGELINQGQRRLLKSLPQGGTVEVFATSVGAYAWASEGFSFDSKMDLDIFRNQAREFFLSFGVALSDQDLAHFTEPVHFSAFTDGGKYKFTFNNITRSGHLGKIFMLGRHWEGVWDSQDNNDATQYAEAPRGTDEEREQAFQVLNLEYQNVLDKVRKSQTPDMEAH